MDRERPAPAISETEFEKPRGIRRVEVREGYAQAHITGLQEPLTKSRIRVLEAVAQAGVSLDFLKFTSAGLSFLVKGEDSERLSSALQAHGCRFSVQKDRRVVIVHAVNIRDEEGLLASIVLKAIGTGAQVDHISDMHDRMLMVVSAEEADRVQAALGGELVGGRA